MSIVPFRISLGVSSTTIPNLGFQYSPGDIFSRIPYPSRFLCSDMGFGCIGFMEDSTLGSSIQPNPTSEFHGSHKTTEEGISGFTSDDISQSCGIINIYANTSSWSTTLLPGFRYGVWLYMIHGRRYSREFYTTSALHWTPEKYESPEV